MNPLKKIAFGMRTDDDNVLLLLTLPGIPSAMRIVIAVFPS
jgi:hypothetical protein